MDLYTKKFPKGVKGLTSKFKLDEGVIYNVGLDAYECKFHSRFSNVKNVNSHKFFENWSKGSFLHWLFSLFNSYSLLLQYLCVFSFQMFQVFRYILKLWHTIKQSHSFQQV